MDKPLILFLDDYEHLFAHSPEVMAFSDRARLEIHTEPLRGEALAQALHRATGLVLMRDRTPVGERELDMAPHLQFVIYTGLRNALLDEAACKARNIPVFNTEFGPTKASTCELTWALILAATKRLEPGFLALRNPDAGWRAGLHYPGLCDVLEGETLGLIGLGQIGARVAKVGQAFGMRVVTWSPNMTPARAAEHGATAVSLDELLATSKVVSLHLVLSAATRYLLQAKNLSQMRPDAVLVNTSRSGLIHEQDLAAALKAGRPGMAALDVFDEEPLPADHPFRHMRQVTLSPHLGFVANPVYDIFAKTVAHHLEGLLSSGAASRG
ncbi:SerA Phosphoglycerate dehydrogenase and related dehydrogenases [Burkholderiales bacterium]